MKKKKILAALLAATMVFTLGACGSNGGSEGGSKGDGDKVYNVGICQLVQHVALDAATQGFQDALIEELGEAHVKFDVQNAQGDSNTCATIVNGFVSANVDLMLANATPALQAAAAATDSIPILGTSITEYGVALELSNFDGLVGTNVSGTSDLAPLDQQAQIIKDLFPEVNQVGLLYCSAEANSQYQVDTVKKSLDALGINSAYYSFSDSNDLSAVVTKAVEDCDVLYIPTDNTCANNTEIIKNICMPAKVPAVVGEEGICAGCGVATLSISYYDLGVATGKMAAKILKGETKVEEMPIEYAPNFTKKYNKEICDELGITVPDDYEAIE